MTLRAPLVTTRTQPHDDSVEVDPFAVAAPKPGPRRRPGLVAAVVVGSLLVIATALYLIGYFVTDWAWRFGVLWRWRQRALNRKRKSNP